ncbi:MAG: hypothetical protein AAFQ63_19585 [Cyanobacteria bacterium J06621_11]
MKSLTPSFKVSKAVGSLSVLLLLGLGPLAIEASAQVFSSQRSQTGSQNGQVDNGTAQAPSQAQTSLQTTLDNQETLYLDKRESYDYDLVLTSASSIGGRRLPVGAVVRGQFLPTEGGLFYQASSVELADRIYQIDAYSDVIRDKKDPRETSTGAILTDAAIGAVGGYVIGEVLGDPDLWEVVGGAAAGVVVGNTTAPFVVVIKPDDLITLYSN